MSNFGMRAPGFAASGEAIHRRKWSDSLGKVPAAMLKRLPTWVRSGPITPAAGVPRTVWQALQPWARSKPWPRLASGVVGASADRA